jgi:hypothetical protein
MNEDAEQATFMSGNHSGEETDVLAVIEILLI